MVLKVNGYPRTPDQSLTSDLERFTVTVAEDIKTKDSDVNGNKKLDVLVATIGMFAQPVVLGDIAGDATDGFTLTFVVEHKGAVVVDALKAAIEATGEFASATVEKVSL